MAERPSEMCAVRPPILQTLPAPSLPNLPAKLLHNQKTIKYPHCISIDRLKREKQIDETMAAVLICARKGQGRFRNDVSAWCPVCPISGVDNKRLLIASHIKPWSKSSNEERLDGYNGFMFAPHIDWLFDRGFISFDEEGKILISPQLDDKNWQALNISPDIQLKKLPEKTKEYLQHHRENVYMHD